MYELPTTITLNDSVFTIRNKGDFRMVLDCFAAIQDISLSQEERAIAALIIFFEDMNDIEDLDRLGDLKEAIHQMTIFFNCGQEEEQGYHSNYKLIDWSKDEMLVTSAINKVAGKEIRLEPYIHWWTFMGYYMAVGESSLSTVVSIRNKIAKGKKLEGYEKEFRRTNPQYFSWDMRSIQDREFEEELRRNWSS